MVDSTVAIFVTMIGEGTPSVRVTASVPGGGTPGVGCGAIGGAGSPESSETETQAVAATMRPRARSLEDMTHTLFPPGTSK
jgi:hypothetical protein